MEKLETIIYMYKVDQVGRMFRGDLGRAQGFELGISGRCLGNSRYAFVWGGGFIVEV